MAFRIARIAVPLARAVTATATARVPVLAMRTMASSAAAPSYVMLDESAERLDQITSGNAKVLAYFTAT